MLLGIICSDIRSHLGMLQRRYYSNMAKRKLRKPEAISPIELEELFSQIFKFHKVTETEYLLDIM